MSESKYLKGVHYKTKKPIQIYMKNGIIQEISTIDVGPDENLDIISPGLIDLQINGFKGVDFNSNPLDISEWEKITKELAAQGITSFYPTIVTNTFKKLADIFRINSQYLKKGFRLSNLIEGFHLEGPYISKKDGPRGAHDANYVRPPDIDELEKLQDYSHNLIKIVTLSPEWRGADSFIKESAKMGTKIALGHLNASRLEIKKAVNNGALFSTHLGNGTHTELPRHENYLWSQLAEDNLNASVIADGHHIPFDLLKIFNRVKKSKMFLVSDSVALAGKSPGIYETFIGGKVTLTEEKKLHLYQNEKILAGSAKSLVECVEHLANSQICELTESLDKASILPAKVMDLPQKQGLNEGAPADLIKLKYINKHIEVTQTIKEGRVIYSSSCM